MLLKNHVHPLNLNWSGCLCSINTYWDVCACFRSDHWKAVLLGQEVCEDREQWSVQTALTLCQQLLQDTHRALDKVCTCTHSTNYQIIVFP